MTRKNTSPLEAALEAVILTIASITASFLMTKVYADSTSTQTLRDHGVQIASGMMVLKRQIENLSIWIDGKRDAEVLPADAIANLEHVQLTLDLFRDMTEAALGGIAGVIGDALNQYATVMEQISRTRVDSLKDISAARRELHTGATPEDVSRIQEQIREIEERTEKSINALAKTSVLPIDASAAKQEIICKCPICESPNKVEMLRHPGETRQVRCQQCKTIFNTHLVGDGNVITRMTFRRIDGAVARANPVGWNTSNMQRVLEDSHISFRPEIARALTDIVISVDVQMKNAGVERSPFRLQATLSNQADSLQQAGLSITAVRKFLTMIYRGKAFRFERPIFPAFRSPYCNDLTPADVMSAYVRSCVWTLINATDPSEPDADGLTILLFGDIANNDLVRAAIKTVEMEVSQRPKLTLTTSVG
jgi:hypothetical protein